MTDTTSTDPVSTDLVAQPPLKTAGDNADGVGGKRSAKDTVKEEAGKLKDHATTRARGFAADGKDKATGALDEVARMIDDAAGSVDEKFGEQYGKYARSAAGAVSGFADMLRGKEVDELLDDTREFVRKSPAVAIGAAAAIGFVLARIVKSGLDGVADAVENESDKA